jgi:hypothetical protein
MKAERAAEKLSAERKELLASRQDFSQEFLAVLQTADMQTVRKFVKELPKVEGEAKPIKKLGSAAAATTPAATRGEGHPGGDSSPLAAISEMDRAMGLVDSKLQCTRQGNSLVFGIVELNRIAPASTPVNGGAK